MHKRLAAVVLVLLAVLVAVPIAAQQERPTIAEWLESDADGRFTTLLAAVDAAGLTETLNSDGPFTVLAPTNDAFDTAFAFLGMTADELMADTEQLRDILLLHVIPGSYFFRNLTSGPTLDAALEGQAVTFNLAGNDFTANGVNIDDVDNVAANGIVHVLEDGILLPSGMFPPAHVRVAHFSPDAPEADFYLNGELSDAQGIGFGTVSDWMEVPIGTYAVALAAARTSIDDAVLGPVNLSFGPGTWTTVAAIGSVENGTLTAQAVPEDFSAIPDGQARVTFFHAVEGAPTVDVLTDGNVAVPELGYPGTLDDGTNDGVFVVTLPAGNYDIQIVETGTSAPALADAPGTELASGFAYLVAAIGTADSPQMIVVPTDIAAMMAADTGQDAGAGDTGTAPAVEATAEATPEMTAPAPEETPEVGEATPEATAEPSGG
jgi:uncharacterized surface protein with fasciclin (FAS1) repeats